MNLQEIIAEVLEHIRGMWRFRWAGLAVAWGLALAGTAYVFTVPDVYQATAKVFVDTNSLLKPLLQGLTATSNTMNVVQLVSRAVLTRPNLEEIAYETDLALRARDQEEMEKLITDLQQRIVVVGGRENIFTIQYEDVSRDKARDVVAAVMSKFIEGAIGNEGDDAELTERALATEIEVHERRLREADEALASFKQENLGYMPGEYGDYYERLQNALAKVAKTQEELRLRTEVRDELYRQVEGEEPVFGIMSTAPGAGSRCSQGADIARLQAEVAELRVNFTDKHPRVSSLNDTIAQLQSECDAELAAASASGLFASTGPEQPLEANPVYQNLRIQLSNVEVELAELRARLRAEEEEVAQLHRDVDKITEVETQLKQLNRDYDVVYARHQELLRRWEDLQAKKRLDPVTDNVQFRPIEPPFAAAEPVGPNRPLLLIGVLIAALGGGGVLTFGLNQMNPTFFTRATVRRAADLPVLGSISLILTPETLARRRREAAAWLLAVLLLIGSSAAAIAFASDASTFVQGLLGRAPL